MKIRLLFLMFFLLSGCAAMTHRYTQSPKAELVGTKIENPGLQGADLIFVVKVENPNAADINLDEIKYEILLDGKPFAKAKTEKKINIPAKGEAEVEIPLPVEYAKLWNGIKKIITGEDLSYAIKGEAKLSFFTIPFHKEGTVDFFKKP